MRTVRLKQSIKINLTFYTGNLSLIFLYIFLSFGYIEVIEHSVHSNYHNFLSLNTFSTGLKYAVLSDITKELNVHDF